MKTEIELLEERIRQIKEAQSHCDHAWGEVQYEPETHKVMREETKRIGVDYCIERYWTGSYETVPRWSRTCTKCGKREYTYTQEEVIIKKIKRPKF